METRQVVLRDGGDLRGDCQELSTLDPDLVLVFGSVTLFRQPGWLDSLRAALPGAMIVGCSTAGEISAQGAEDLSCVATGISFSSTVVRAVGTEVADLTDSGPAGERLGAALLAAADGQAPTAVLMFGRGTDMNGSALIEGLQASLGADVAVSGGLAGDDGAFASTIVVGPTNATDGAVAVGLYGDSLRMSYGSFGGWQPFGPTRRVTAAAGNILYTLDDEPALEIYRRYLGDYAKDLPASGLLFPFEMLDADASSQGLIRTILGINEEDGSLVLAGTVEEGCLLRMMNANTDALIDGAERAAYDCLSTTHNGGLALLVSCVGRKLVMGDRVDEEVEVVADILGRHLTPAGFYSYGELGPHAGSGTCKLHNQTMTVTALSEA